MWWEVMGSMLCKFFPTSIKVLWKSLSNFGNITEISFADNFFTLDKRFSIFGKSADNRQLLEAKIQSQQTTNNDICCY
jgi:hypothetical protein